MKPKPKMTQTSLPAIEELLPAIEEPLPADPVDLFRCWYGASRVGDYVAMARYQSALAKHDVMVNRRRRGTPGGFGK